jgi:hypothetical protein
MPSWRDVILVKCKYCKKLMSHHIEIEEGICVECELSKRAPEPVDLI